MGAEAGVTAGVAAAAVLGIALSALMWWAYFDTDASVAARHLSSAPEGRERNEMARDSYSLLHFLIVLGLALVLLASVPLVTDFPALATLALVCVLLCVLVVYESVRFADPRDEVRHGHAGDERPLP